MKPTRHLWGVLALAAGLSAQSALAALPAAACNLSQSSQLDTYLVGNGGEDNAFFTQTQNNNPNVLFFLANSASMQNLPPNGAEATWGDFGNGSGSVGGLNHDPGCNNGYGNGLTYNSPCGLALDDNPNAGFFISDQPFDGGVDYAHEASICPYVTHPGGTTATGLDGFDPDFYPTYFDKTRAYHDYDGLSLSGWNATTTSPYTSPDGGTTWSQYCDAQGGNAALCQSCMQSQGYYFDGTTLPQVVSCATNGTADCLAAGAGQCNYMTHLCELPNVYFNGNFLNFYPPKFIIARKVLKDQLAQVTNERIGFVDMDDSTVLDAGVPIYNGGGLMQDPFSTSCASSSTTGNLNQITNDINATTFDLLTKVPVAETLLNIGEYFHSQALTWFTGTANDWSPWGGYNKGSFNVFNNATAAKNSICSPCQTNAIILITDGSPVNDVHVPPGTTTLAQSNTTGTYAGDPTTGIAGLTCPNAGGVDRCTVNSPAAGIYVPSLGTYLSAGSSPYMLPKVAWYLHHMDLRNDSDSSQCGSGMAGKQYANIYTIGLGTGGITNDTSTIPNQLLTNTSYTSPDLSSNDVGGGLFFQANSADQLSADIQSAFTDINSRSTSFGSASVSAVQSSSGGTTFIPRFDPSRSVPWQGHMYRYALMSEFAVGCDPTAAAAAKSAGTTYTLDFDCDGKCNSVFLVDSSSTFSPPNPIFISEDSTGAFQKNSPNMPTCGTSQCGSCGSPTGGVATPYWDVANTVQDAGWSTRQVYTVIDDQAPTGIINSADTVFQITVTNTTLADGGVIPDSTVADKLTPYIITNQSQCIKLENRLNQSGNRNAAFQIGAEIGGSGSNPYHTCVAAMLGFMLGEDIFDSNGSGSFTDDRTKKLGDIYHSSPVVVGPPAPSTSTLANAGLVNQTLSSLWNTPVSGPSTATPANATAYDDYATSSNYQHRPQVVLVGANDGLLHAFHSGTWQSGATPPTYDTGTGKEIWAFLPPDLLAKIPLLVGTSHQFFVDGTAMVRDIWVDGSGNGLGTGTANRVKEGSEFHTVAVVGEGRGGTHYFGLDVTDSECLPGSSCPPKFLWEFPQPNDSDELYFGETFTNFLPTPPPIGPIRIKDTSSPYSFTGVSGSVNYDEEWVVLLAGGWDRQYLRGKGVYMLDAWTGNRVWSFNGSYTGTATCPSSNVTDALNFPFVATPGMMMWGKNGQDPTGIGNNGYFDTATVGDSGGQIWTLRFSEPGDHSGGCPAGTCANGGLSGNWYGARAFELNGGCDTFCSGQPFFYVTANVALSANGFYRVLAGTGDRWNLLDTKGGTCSSNNPRACQLAGCKVQDHYYLNATKAIDLEANCSSNKDEYLALVSPSSCGNYSVAQQVNISGCPGKISGFKLSEGFACTSGSSIYSCAAASTLSGSDPVPGLTITNPPGNWYVSVKVFDPSGNRGVFYDSTTAKNYDASRLSLDAGTIVQIDANSTSPALASGTGDGWAMFYDHCPATGATGACTSATTVDAGTQTFNVNQADERTASATSVLSGCAIWNTVQPSLPATVTCSATSCSSTAGNVSYSYYADVSTGGLCPGIATQPSRSIAATTLAPPPAPQETAFVNSQGQVIISAVTPPAPGSGALTPGATGVNDPVAGLGVVAVDSVAHACRHNGAIVGNPDTPPAALVCKPP